MIGSEFLNRRMPRPSLPLHRWHTDSAFLGPYGVPLELPLTGQGGRNFTDLVAGSPIAISATNAFEQLLAAKMIAKSGDTHVKVMSRSYVMPEPLSAEMLEHFGSAMTNLASTLNFNMTPSQTSKRLERSVFPDDGLPDELREEFDQFVRDRAQELISDVDDWLAAAARRPIQKPTKRTNTGVSVFQYVTPADQQIELEKYFNSGS